MTLLITTLNPVAEWRSRYPVPHLDVAAEKMKYLRSFALIAALALSTSAQDRKDPEFRDAMRENILARIAESDSVVTICVYEEEWIPPTEEEWKGEIVQRAVVTSVHKGNLTVGTQLEFSYLVEDSPKLFSKFRATVPGEMKYLFFSHEGMQRTKGKMILGLGAHWSCDRLEGIYAELFQAEVARNPTLITQGEQVGTGQPAIRPESKSEGGDQPQPEAEGRSR
jgi:hypothetical protein